jgi:hypothetical protein
MQEKLKTIIRHPSWYLWPLPALAAFLAQRILAGYPDLVERFHARGLFRILSIPISFLTSLAPFSLTELAVVLGGPVLLALLIVWIIRLARRPGKLSRAGRLLRRLAWTASLLYLLFMLLHGLNYARQPVAVSFGLPARDRTADDLRETAIWLAEQTTLARGLGAEDERGVFRLRDGIQDTLRQASLGYAAAARDYPLLDGIALRPKGVLLSHLWSYTGVIGIYMPFLVESNVNVDVPHYLIPDTALHEIAHTRGFAREDEAGFLAFLTGIAHENADFAYSVLLDTTIRCLSALAGVDEAGYKTAASLLSDGVWRDLAANAAYWKQFEGPIQETSTRINDAYLQANLQTDGVRSYGRMVDLVLAWHEQMLDQGSLDSQIVVLAGLR